MSQLKVLCSEDSQEVVALANRLDGEFVNFLVCDRGYNFSFRFSKSTFAEQFQKAVSLYPEVLEVIA
jgi:hypothetical protein